MAVSYECDLCGRPIEEGFLGGLTVHGVESEPVVQRRGRMYRKYHPRYRMSLELCPICAKGTFEGIDALVENAQKARESEEERAERRS